MAVFVRPWKVAYELSRYCCAHKSAGAARKLGEGSKVMSSLVGGRDDKALPALQKPRRECCKGRGSKVEEGLRL